MHRLFSWTADAVGCWARLVVGVCSPFQKIDHDTSMVDYSAKCAPAFAPAHTIPIDIHHRHALTCDLRIPNPAWFRDSTDLFFHFFLSQPDRKACFYPPPPGLFFYGAPKSPRARARALEPSTRGRQHHHDDQIRCPPRSNRNSFMILDLI